jgi:NAD(P)-dependent dehydrogenase (short-subunit alcohol dehydrogenase family)
MVKKVISETGRIDILINNAGIAGPIGELHTIKSDEWDKVFNVNVRGAFLCAN